MDGLLSAASSLTTFKHLNSSERNRCKNQYVLRWNTEKVPREKVNSRGCQKAATSVAMVKQNQEGKGNAYIPQSGRFWQRPTDEQLRSQLRCQCKNWRQIHGSQASSSQSSTTWWEPQQWQERHQWQERQDWHGWQENWTTEFRFPWPPSHFANFFASQSIVLSWFGVQTLPNVVHATGREDRTPHRAHHRRIFSRAAHIWPTNAHALAQGLTAQVRCMLKSSSFSKVIPSSYVPP